MIPSSGPGGKPSVSSRVENYLNADDDTPIYIADDEFDKLIQQEQLRISRFIPIRELDLVLVVLSNSRVISQNLSAFPMLMQAQDAALSDYVITDSGIHWPSIDADLSLRGLLMDETLKRFANRK